MKNTLPSPGHSRRDSPTFATHSISKDTRLGSKTLLHLLIQQQRVGIFWDGRYRVFACAMAIRVLGGSKTWNARLWVYVACNLAVGVSLALPLFLLFRERTLDRS